MTERERNAWARTELLQKKLLNGKVIEPWEKMELLEKMDYLRRNSEAKDRTLKTISGFLEKEWQLGAEYGKETQKAGYEYIAGAGGNVRKEYLQ